MQGEFDKTGLMYHCMVDVSMRSRCIDAGWMYRYRVDVLIEGGCVDTW